ncbi:TPA: hypothetical protein ACJIBH_003648 [Shigella sonnei]|nr:hypothetical protein [Shigella sonnei]
MHESDSCPVSLVLNSEQVKTANFLIQKKVNHGSLAAANRGVAEYELSE